MVNLYGSRGWAVALIALGLAGAAQARGAAPQERALDAAPGAAGAVPAATDFAGPVGATDPVEAGAGSGVRVRLDRAGGAPAVELTGGRPWLPCLLVVGLEGRDPSLREAPDLFLPLVLDGQGRARVDLGLGDGPLADGAAARVFWSEPGSRIRGSARVELGGGADAAPGPGAAFQRGSLVITEFMKDPSFVTDSNGEWIEFYNPGGGRVNLEGMTLTDEGSNSHTFSNNGLGLFVRPGKYLVVGNNVDVTTNGGVQVRYRYTSYTLGNGADAIVLTHPSGQVLDRVDYDDGVLWPDMPGMSISLRPGMEDAVANDDPLNWCHASSPIGGGNPDTGTPRQANDPCP